MTISSNTRKAGPFIGNGVTVAFPFAFKVFSATDVVVVITTPAGVESTLENVTDYTVSLNADQNAAPGGTVTLNTAPAADWLVTITSGMATLQPLDLTNQGGFYPSVINDALDRATILIQQVAEQVGRAVKTGISSSVNPDDLLDSIQTNASNAAASASSASSSASSASSSASAASASAAAAAASAASVDAANLLTKSGNLTGLSDASAARANLGLGTAATKNTGTTSGNVPLVGTVSATEALAGLSRRATTAEAQAGTDDTAHMTALKTAQAIAAMEPSSLGSSGYQKLASGFIVQWGNIATSGSGGVTLTYPIAFPTAVVSGSLQLVAIPSSTAVHAGMDFSGLSSMTVYTRDATSGAYAAANCKYLIIGY